MDLHYLQIEILKQISLNPDSPFSVIQNKEITSNLFAYHVKKLLLLKLVEKNDDRYSLTTDGKKFVNRLEIEKEFPVFTNQPKVGILIYPFFGTDFSSDFIARTRLKEPFYGYTGTISTRFRFGEPVEQTIKKEMEQRVGFTFESSQEHGYQRIINKLDNEVVEDKIFFIYSVYGLSGSFNKNDDLKDFRVSPEKFWKMDKIYTGQREGWEIMTGKRDSGETFEFNLQEF